MSASDRLQNIWKYLLTCIILISGICVGYGQATYNMTDAFVTDCEGILLDSEDGPEEGQYNHNEDYIFTICVDGADEIILSFDFFATEITYDILNIYDGPDTGSPLITSLSGVIQPAPIIIATSGCLTLHFVSDDNIVATGWQAEWTIELDEPEPPNLEVITEIICPLESAIFAFDPPIDCSNFDAANFSIAGPGGSSIASINVLDCDSNTNLGSEFEVVFSPPLSEEGSYRLLYAITIQDACEEWHDIESSILFELENCPFDVYIDIEERGCEGECGALIAVITGGDSPAYQFEWSHTNLNQAIVEICAETATDVSVTVTDLTTNQVVTANFTYIPVENPVILNPLNHDTICAGASNHLYQVSLGGGEFYSRVIPDWERTSGRYQFWRWSNASGLEQDIVNYYAPNGCVASDTFYILPINAGSHMASCLDADPFVVNGGTPVGGQWVGQNIDPDGTFTPSEEGSFWVTYEAPNGCTRSKRVNVASEIVMPDIDTICSSIRIWLEAEPYGGRWSGPAIINTLNGRLDPWRVAPNQTYTYYYEMNGCLDSMEIYIQELWSGPDRLLCSEETTLTLNQRGDWQGPGIYNAIDSSFDISNLSSGWYTYTIRLGDCTDEFDLQIVTPRIDIKNDPYFCLEDNWYSVYDFLDVSPGGGIFSGAQVAENNDNWYFNPSLVGPGTHKIYYEALGCLDSMTVEVEAPAVIQNYSVCEFNPIFQMEANPPGGSWWGDGFIDPQSGLYDPRLVGAGTYDIYYYTPTGCETAGLIEVFSFEEVSIDGLDQQYCFNDTMIELQIAPTGGDFYINGIPALPQFNPSDLGVGNHEIMYTKGEGDCESTERKFISIMPPISGITETNRDSICQGQNTEINIVTSGGVSNLTSTWSDGLGFGTSHIVNPNESKWYYVEVRDGCSDPYFDSVYIHVFPEFNIQIETGPEVCFEDSTFAMIITPDPDNYVVTWLTNPPVESDILEAQPGIYFIEVVESNSGCKEEFEIQLPGAQALKANFSVNPNQDCIDIIDNEIEIINLATGYSDGWIDFGDGSPAVSMDGSVIFHEYQEIGDFTITQVIRNEIGCTDSISVDLCIENKIQFYIPNAFSPNEDEVNDLLIINAFGVSDVSWSTYDRWGNKLFESGSLEEGWDGKFQGKNLVPGVYVLKFEFTDPVYGNREIHWQTVTLLR